MSQVKQIEEMAKAIYEGGRFRCAHMVCFDCQFGLVDDCKEKAVATHLHDLGYRKQSEGCDFCKAGSEKCGTCVKFFDYHEDGGSDRCSSEYGNEKCAYYKPVHHCSNCGAKMKGGTE